MVSTPVPPKTLSLNNLDQPYAERPEGTGG
ncbi:hypothetical protein EMEDMD4_440177 [Sinorhizobium medicae]|uniref:Uncharacterized protein n=1 Tax=Sinorhizobium medicae TaxID=110321 RepID=A0A508X4Y5_9HYPH|nr:hypothetical protein EMEDMD4_440177 [Sinorhizobium medicae]